ncbi:NUDIX domain-containing protein [Streptomyces buecherae]|uniref:NUDIX domain-containing protein n=2 Tax=Streptomyces buecherae TaxID=2763006 RepID=UPI001C26DE67
MISDQPLAARVRFTASGLVVTRTPGEPGVYSLPRVGQTVPAAERHTLPRGEALLASIRPVGTSESVLRSWVTGRRTWGAVPWADPAAVTPERIRAAALVIRDAHLLLIRFRGDDGEWYEIPGGGVEPGETPRDAVVRELREETGLTVTPTHEVARVWRRRRFGHYFRVTAEGRVGAPDDLDIEGGELTWVPVAQLPTTPLWPRRLSWRITHWHTTGWPTRPLELADNIQDLRAPCTW